MLQTKDKHNRPTTDNTKQSRRMKVSLRLSSGGKFDITLDPSITILEFKELIAKEQNIPVEQQRLIYKGRILKDAMTVSSYRKYRQT